MRTLLLLLVVLLGALQWRLWFSDSSLPGIWQKEGRLNDLTMSQDYLLERNRKLAAEVDDLKTGLGAVEARARLDLGLIGPHETFYQVIEDTRPDQITPGLGPRDSDLGGDAQSVPTTPVDPGAAKSLAAHQPSVMTARGR
ncbi:FtsB family cell division protein [Halothiobacillus sp.]|uniref:FtsB family cell division protein n=1 Tax=Halothiobacillus sp. TaxID=1891311 RepID=UPI002AD3A1F4|nr:septum formation initiator family protein [Halothiobacillus sp.]